VPAELPGELVAEVCARIGASLPVDADGVADLYRAWCAHVPFDPVAKAVAVREGATPPGADAIEVAQRWLATGVGSTCWGHVTVLGALLGAAGVPSSVGLDRLQRDDGVIDFHAFLVVDVGDGLAALDPIHPSGGPLPLVPGARGTHPTYRTGVDADGARLSHWFHQPDRGERTGRYALLSTCLDGADVAAFCAVSARFSGVTSNRFFLRRATPEAFVTSRVEEVGGEEGETGEAVERALVTETWTADGVARQRYDHPEAALAALGYHGEALTLVERAGFLGRGDDRRWTWCEQVPPPDRYRAPSGR
jgi:hypothetical protein